MATSEPAFDVVLDGKELDVAVGAAVERIEWDLNVDSTAALTITVHDQARALWASPIFDRDRNGRLDRLVEVLVNGTPYRLAAVSKAQNVITLTFEDKIVALLRSARGKLKPRDGTDDVAFARRLVLAVGGKFVTPTGVAVATDGGAAKHKKARADADARREKGLVDGVVLKIKGVKATAPQLRNIEIAMGVAAKEKAGERPTEAMLCAGIGESDFTNAPPNAGGYRDVFQGTFTGVALQVHYFLRGGRGFNQGGAIALAKKYPDMHPGEIATRVETSGEPGDFYGKYLSEAKAIIAAYHGTGGIGGTSTSPAPVQIQRGTTENPDESSYEALVRIARVKGKRVIADRGTIIYAREQDLIDSRPRVILSEDLPGVDWIDGEWLPGKKINTATASVLASLHALPPACAVIVENSGPLDGRWLVSSFKRPQDSVQASVELRRGTDLLQPEAAVESTSGAIVTGGAQGESGAAGSLFEVCGRFKGPYVYGGGHSGLLSALSFTSPMDCSSSCAKALKEVGLFNGASAIVSGQFAASWGSPGRGSDFTCWANSGHVWLEFHGEHDGYRFDTNGSIAGSVPSDRGPRLRKGRRSTAGFTARHVSGR